jgi:hypothetical protein
MRPIIETLTLDFERRTILIEISNIIIGYRADAHNLNQTYQ